LDQRLDLIRAVEEAALRVPMEEMNEFRIKKGIAASRGGVLQEGDEQTARRGMGEWWYLCVRRSRREVHPNWSCRRVSADEIASSKPW
jgi:hypothetical protein